MTTFRLRNLTDVACLSIIAFLLAAAPFSTAANAWPEHPVKFITLVGAGGGSDAVARTIADALSKEWRQPVVVENKPGADGIIAINTFMGAQDGHTLLFASTGVVTTNPLIHSKLPYDAFRDLVPVSFAVEDFIAVVTAPGIAHSLPELIKRAQERREPFNYATVPGPPYLFSVALQSNSHFKMTLVPYRNPIAALEDVITSRIEVAFMPLASVLSLAKAQRLTVLAVTNPKRSPAAPNVPTVADAGFDALGFAGGLGFFAPKDMPADLRSRIAGDIARVLVRPELRQRLEDLGYVARGDGPDSFEQILHSQAAKWTDLVRRYNIAPTD